MSRYGRRSVLFEDAGPYNIHISLLWSISREGLGERKRGGGGKEGGGRD